MKTLNLTFIGKDSVKYTNEFEVPDEVASLVEELQAGKKPTDHLFENAGEVEVNAFLRECLPECTAKLFRTAYGTKILAEELQAHPCTPGMTDAQKKAIYNNAALEVSKKLNHQRNVSKNFNDQSAKMDEKVKEAKAKNKETKEKIKQDLEKLKKDIQVAKKCFTGDRLKEKLAKLKEKKQKLEERLIKSDQRVEVLEINRDFKNNTKNIAIGTAKSAYSSPEIAYSWCKTNGIDIKFIYSKSLAEKFAWAADADNDYWKNYPN